MQLKITVSLLRQLFVPLLCVALSAPLAHPAAATSGDLVLRPATSTLDVQPPAVIRQGVGAKISHAGTGNLTVTITGDLGQVVTVEVPAGQTITWMPPAGWNSATFDAPGHSQEFRTIQ